jgi:hypothetical protein
MALFDQIEIEIYQGSSWEIVGKTGRPIEDEFEKERRVKNGLDDLPECGQNVRLWRMDVSHAVKSIKEF